MPRSPPTVTVPEAFVLTAMLHRWCARWFQYDFSVQIKCNYLPHFIAAHIPHHSWTCSVTYCEGFVHNPPLILSLDRCCDLSCAANMAPTFRIEYYTRYSDWLTLLGWFQIPDSSTSTTLSKVHWLCGPNPLATLALPVWPNKTTLLWLDFKK